MDDLYGAKGDEKLDHAQDNHAEPCINPDDDETENEEKENEKKEEENESKTASDASEKEADGKDDGNTPGPSDKESDEGDISAKDEKDEESSEKAAVDAEAAAPDILQKFDERLTALQESLTKFNESLDRFEVLSKNISDKLPQIIAAANELKDHLQNVEKAVEEEKQLRSDIRQCTHWLENTNKHYTEIMTAMPNQLYDLYLSQARFYEKKFRETFTDLDKRIKAEMEAVKPPAPVNYYILGAIAVIQAIFVIYMLR